ncbi:MAG: type II toxin-antitoxin system RelB/DinJ family antitoxin [Anaerolineae bacterium]
MSNVTVQARIDRELKEEADAVLAALGLSTAEAIRIFLQQVVNSGGLPFRPSVKQPSPETQAALAELEDGGGQTFTNTADLFADWRR